MQYKELTHQLRLPGVKSARAGCTGVLYPAVCVRVTLGPCRALAQVATKLVYTAGPLSAGVRLALVQVNTLNRYSYNQELFFKFFCLCRGVKVTSSLYRDTGGSGDTEIQGVAEIQRYKDTEIQRYRDTEIKRYRDTEIQRCRDTEIQRYRDTEIQINRETKIEGVVEVNQVCYL